MRTLNKIIFINSAGKSLPYAEIQLDGNVHLIGTQGVGKSTLLRAILFFYTADTQKLDIPLGKETYPDFYFPYVNSYIVYEVKIQTGHFCVLTYKNQGRVMFRFFNSAYDSSYFLDEQPKAFESWDKIRDTLSKNKVRYTRQIQTYEEYRDVIYGDSSLVKAEFRPYALLNSKQYQNIPRTIANVFLNSKLDADFIKTTIIKSLNEEETKIELDTYAHTHLRNFKREVSDLQKWTHKDKNEENKIQNLGDKIIDFYREYNFKEQEEKEFAVNLGLAIWQYQKDKPDLTDKLNEEEDKIEQLTQQRIRLENKFSKEKDRFIGQIAIQQKHLDEIKDKQAHYAEIGIENLLTRVGKKEDLVRQKEDLEKEKDILTAQFSDIQRKYEQLFTQLSNKEAAFKNQKDKEQNKLNPDFYEVKEKLKLQYELLISEIEKQHRQELEAEEEKLKAKQEEITNTKIAYSEIKHRVFYEQEVHHIQRDISDLKEEIRQMETKIQSAKLEREAFRKSGDLERKEIETENQRKAEKIQEQIKNSDHQIKGIDQKLNNTKGSFYEWLEKEIPEWQETIGKVIDEDQVLFSKVLNPKKKSGSDKDFYGIQLDLANLNKSVQSLENLSQQKQELQKQIQSFQSEFDKLTAKKEDDLRKLKNRYSKKISEQNDIIKESEYNLEKGTKESEALQIKHKDWQAKAVEDKRKALVENSNLQEKLSKEKIDIEEEIRLIQNRISRKVNEKKREKQAELEKEEKLFQKLFRQTEKELSEFKKEIEQRTKSLKTQQEKELHNKGADTDRLFEIDNSLERLVAELDFIEDKRDLVVEYNKDKRDLFDKEEDFKNQRYILKKDLKNLEDDFEDSLKMAVHKIKNQGKIIEEIKRGINQIDANLNAFEQFQKEELFADLKDLIRIQQAGKPKAESGIDLIRSLHTSNGAKTRKYEQLRESVNEFAGNFDEGNQFNFPVKFTFKSDYFDFAETLKEFLEENKIDEYKKRVEERFGTIIQQIGKETNDLIAKSGEIQKLINQINNDFKERNFVGAINSIELKTTESQNTVFQLLLAIQKFNDEQGMSLGTLNLFSDSESENQNQRAVQLLIDFSEEIQKYGKKEITLSDAFELLFRIEENDNDSGWVERLSNVGSQGTDVLAKAMINIMLINVFKERVSRKAKNDFRLHCMLDEIGRLHPENVAGILKFANDRNILLINGSPTSYNAADYRYTYLLSRHNKQTKIALLVKKKNEKEFQKDEIIS